MLKPAAFVCFAVNPASLSSKMVNSAPRQSVAVNLAALISSSVSSPAHGQAIVAEACRDGELHFEVLRSFARFLSACRAVSQPRPSAKQ